MQIDFPNVYTSSCHFALLMSISKPFSPINKPVTCGVQILKENGNGRNIDQYLVVI